jgi:tetratricopeptide (TPR) repeat protein
MAIAHRNLGWGYYQYQGDGYKAIAEYEKAVDLKKDEPIYYEELDNLYEMSNTPIEKRLKLYEGNNEIVSIRDNSFASQIAVLTLGGKADKAVEYLAGRQFNYREGNSRVRDVIINAYLMLGLKYLEEKNYQKALDNFILAQVPEEEASGSRANNRNIQVNYFTGIAYEAMGDKTNANKSFVLCAELVSKSSGYISYYQGLGYLKLGKKAEALEIFNTLVADGEKQIKQKPSDEVDFFAKFGKKEVENVRLSNAYLLEGLGYKGLGKTKLALENLKKAIELSVSNLWAKSELQNL